MWPILICLPFLPYSQTFELRELPAIDYRAPAELQTAIHTPITARWDNVGLREILRSLSTNQRIGILLDRRVDPTTIVEFSLASQSLEQGLPLLLRPTGCEAAVTSSFIYVGPAEPTKWLRTTIAQRELEVSTGPTAATERRQFALWRRTNIEWSNLTTPGEILQKIATTFDLKVEGQDQLRYDLLAGAAMPHATAAEALCSLLIQYELDFRWIDHGHGITLVPFRPPSLITRSYAPQKPLSAKETWDQWKAQYPTLEGAIVNGRVEVSGRIEDHELLAGTSREGNESAGPTKEPTALRRRKWTLRTENVPISAIMRELEKSGARFQYDQAAFAEAGIDLETTISLNVRQVTSEVFLKELFKPLPIDFNINHLDVTLTLKR